MSQKDFARCLINAEPVPMGACDLVPDRITIAILRRDTADPDGRIFCRLLNDAEACRSREERYRLGNIADGEGNRC